MNKNKIEVVTDDSMWDGVNGYNTGDIFYNCPVEKITNGKQYVVRVGDEIVIRAYRYCNRTDTVSLTPCNPFYKITTHDKKDVTVIGTPIKIKGG